MKHKWHDEIVAWAGGKEIEYTDDGSTWYDITNPNWSNTTLKFRIKPTPKEPQYLYVYLNQNSQYVIDEASLEDIDSKGTLSYIGTIKLEVDDAV